MGSTLSALKRCELSVFLATTALSEFWDKEQEILCLGSWCLRYDKRSEWKSLKYLVMPSPWDDRKRFYEATRYLDDFGERMLHHLTDYLNSVHGESHTLRYWRILIGPWLFHYLHAAYDRYIHLTEAFSRYPELQTLALDHRSFRVPRDTREFSDLAIDDPYNLQLFSQFMNELGYTFPVRLFPNDPLDQRSENGGTVKGWRSTTHRAAYQAASHGLHLAGETVSRACGRRWRIALCDMTSPPWMRWTIAWRTHLGVIPLWWRNEWSFALPNPVFDERRTGFVAIPSAQDFERVVVQSLSQNFPTLYLEGYQSARAEVHRKYHRIPPVIVSGTGWYHTEPFKFFAADACESGSRLVTVQNGGGYGIYRFSGSELHESRIGDSFMVWGWADQKGGPFRNLPSLKLSSRLNRHFRKSNSYKAGTILFVATGHPRYLFRFDSTPVGSQFESYWEWELRFLAAISDRLRSTILFRPYHTDYGHATRKRTSERFADIRWDDGRPISHRLKQSRLVVIDHSATTFLETLVANIPTVLFWDPQRWEVRDEALPYFESLRRVGILWDSPEAAAAKVEAVYDEPWTWWESNAVQEARRTFVDRYALGRTDCVDCWVKALEEESALTKARGHQSAGGWIRAS